MRWALHRLCARAAAGVLVAVVWGCGGLGDQVVAPGAMSPNVPDARDALGSWMSPEAKAQDLLYVGDSYGFGKHYKVYVFSYPAGKHVGTLSGFEGPMGECVDTKGDVFIVDENDYEIVEYAHGGRKPIAWLSDPKLLTQGCAVDPTSGNLAVTGFNHFQRFWRRGSVSIYEHAAGTPKQHALGSLHFPLFCAYDSAGNLFVDGDRSFNGGGFWLAELPKGAKTFTRIKLDVSIRYAGILQWVGDYLAVGDALKDEIYQVQVSGSNGTVIGSTVLNGADDNGQYWIAGPQIVGPASEHSIGVWTYPSGGSTIKSLTGPYLPYGTVISPAR